MNSYCSLEDAFQEVGAAPSPGCGSTYGTREARREERKKIRRRAEYQGGNRGRSEPAAAQEVDPDRQTVQHLPEVPMLQGSDTFHSASSAAHANSWLHSTNYHKCEADKGSPDCDKDPMDAYLKGEERGHIMVVPVQSAATTVIKPKKFFGAGGPDEDTFADYVPDQGDYRLQPDFAGAFSSSANTDRASSSSLPPVPIQQYWKPITPSGAQTSFIEHLPPAAAADATANATQLLRTRNGEEVTVDELMRRLDALYARLDDMNQGSPEQMTSEILMFISSGIFVMFMMDLLVRRR